MKPFLKSIFGDIHYYKDNNNYDYIFTNGGMCLLEDKSIAFNNIYASLKNNGWFEGIISGLKHIPPLVNI
jgi:hypothetical protein